MTVHGVLLVLGVCIAYSSSSSATNTTHVPLAAIERATNTTNPESLVAIERHRRLIPYMTYYFSRQQFGNQPQFQQLSGATSYASNRELPSGEDSYANTRGPIRVPYAIKSTPYPKYSTAVPATVNNEQIPQNPTKGSLYPTSRPYYLQKPQYPTNNAPYFRSNVQHLTNNVPYSASNVPYSANNVLYSANNVQNSVNSVPFSTNNVPYSANNVPYPNNNVPYFPNKNAQYTANSEFGLNPSPQAARYAPQPPQYVDNNTPVNMEPPAYTGQGSLQSTRTNLQPVPAGRSLAATVTQLPNTVPQVRVISESYYPRKTTQSDPGEDTLSQILDLLRHAGRLPPAENSQVLYPDSGRLPPVKDSQPLYPDIGRLPTAEDNQPLYPDSSRLPSVENSQPLYPDSGRLPPVEDSRPLYRPTPTEPSETPIQNINEDDYEYYDDDVDIPVPKSQFVKLTPLKVPFGTSHQTFPASEGGTPGKPGIDYPILDKIPETTFDCKNQRYKGFFGDPDTNCQVWHYCDLNGGQASFLCPNGTIFSQVGLTCDWWFNVRCESTVQLYVLNERLYKYILPAKPSFPEDYSGPIVDRYLTLKFQEKEEKRKEKEKEKENKTT